MVSEASCFFVGLVAGAALSKIVPAVLNARRYEQMCREQRDVHPDPYQIDPEAHAAIWQDALREHWRGKGTGDRP